VALAEHAADDLRVQQESSTESKFGSLKGVELEISDDIVAEDIEQFTGKFCDLCRSMSIPCAISRGGKGRCGPSIP
jgi:hypothetical protein